MIKNLTLEWARFLLIFFFATTAFSASIGKEPLPEKAYSGGAMTRWSSGKNAFNLPSPNLSSGNRSSFFVGDSFFKQNWIAAPASATARDGVGPFFNARSCSACHQRDGRGRVPYENEEPVSLIFKISRIANSGRGVPAPHPIYGEQLQNFALDDLKPEVSIRVKWEKQKGSFQDGEEFELRKPIYKMSNWRNGPPKKPFRLSTRLAPQVFGLGLLQAIPENKIKQWSDPEDSDGDGISGRLQRVETHSGPKVGRFGWKAEQPDLKSQTAKALHTDMGLSSSVHPQDLDHQEILRQNYPKGGEPEVEDHILDHLSKYPMLLGVPGRRDTEDPKVKTGEELFNKLQCSKCHKAEVKTGEIKGVPEVSSQRIQPFTDLLLHDMGPDLADQRPVFEASGREWRTPPLWGLGLFRKVNGYLFLLHDGRARSIEEAILWHGGEAENAKKKFLQLDRKERDRLKNFLLSL